MNMNYTTEERRKLAQANFEAAFSHLEDLMDHPEKISSIPDGAIVILPTENEWVNQQNEAIGTQWSKEENRPLYRTNYQPLG